MRKYSSCRYSSCTFSRYAREFIVRPGNAIDYGEFDITVFWQVLYNSITFCAFIGLCDRVRFFTNTRIPRIRFLSFLPTPECLLLTWYFFRAKQPVIIAAWRHTSQKPSLNSGSLNRGPHNLHCVKKKSGLKSGLETSNANDAHSLALLTHYIILWNKYLRVSKASAMNTITKSYLHAHIWTVECTRVPRRLHAGLCRMDKRIQNVGHGFLERGVSGLFDLNKPELLLNLKWIYSYQ